MKYIRRSTKMTLVLSLFMCCYLAILGCIKNKPTLYIYSWSDYFNPALLEQFEKENNCTIDVTAFDSNEAMYAKLKAGGVGYDIVVPSSYQIALMSNEGLLDKIDLAKMPNVVENFDHSFDKHLIDPSMKYSVPYAVTYAGFMYAKDKFPNLVCLNDIFSSQNAKNMLTLLDDIREVIGLGLIANGCSINTESQEEIDRAVETVLSWKSCIRKFDAESYKQEVASKLTYIGHGYSSDAIQVILGEDDTMARTDIGFFLPSDGFTMAFDELAIMKDAKNKDLAMKFIDFLYDKDVAKQNIEYVGAQMANRPALAEISEKFKKLLPTEEQLKNAQLIRGFEDKPEIQEMYNKAWDRIRAIDN